MKDQVPSEQKLPNVSDKSKPCGIKTDWDSVAHL